MSNDWIEFEGWMGDVSIQGYMNVEDADDEAPLQFYDCYGLECGSHIINTKYPSFKNDQEIRWEKLTQWFAEHDVVQDLVDFADEEKELLFAFEDDFGRIEKIELFINCSKLN